MATGYEERIQVVGVCGNEATVYGLPDDWGFRPFVSRQWFSNYGQARQFAVDYEAKQRDTAAMRQKQAKAKEKS